MMQLGSISMDTRTLRTPPKLCQKKLTVIYEVPLHNVNGLCGVLGVQQRLLGLFLFHKTTNAHWHKRDSFLNTWLRQNLCTCTNAVQQLTPQINLCVVWTALLVTEQYARRCGCSVCLVWTSVSFYLLGMLEDKHIAIIITLKTWKIILNVIFSISPTELQHAKDSVFVIHDPSLRAERHHFQLILEIS
jgi:hypothetical protein